MAAAFTKESHYMVCVYGKQWPAVPYQPPMEIPTEVELQKPTPYHNIYIFIPIINQSLWVMPSDLGKFDNREFDTIDKDNEPKRYDAFMTIIDHLADGNLPQYGYWASEILVQQLADESAKELAQDEPDETSDFDDDLTPIPAPTPEPRFRDISSDDDLTPILTLTSNPKTGNFGESKSTSTGRGQTQSLTSRTTNKVEIKKPGSKNSLQQLDEPTKENPVQGESELMAISAPTPEPPPPTTIGEISEPDRRAGGNQSRMTGNSTVTQAGSRNSLQRLHQMATDNLEEMKKKKKKGTGKRKRNFIPDECDDELGPTTKKPKVSRAKRSTKTAMQKGHCTPAPAMLPRQYFLVEEDDEFNDIKNEPEG